MDTKRARVVVSGRVQGVFFRDTARRVATEAGATGLARNRDDGTVEVEVQGSAEAVERVVAFCSEGPPRAQVTDVAVEEIDPVDGERGFRTR